MHPSVSLDSLRCFLEAARTRNFRLAARVVALTPTAFGQRIKQLEDQLGARLFARTTRSITLTEHGLSLIPVAERCLTTAVECERIARGPAEHPPMDLTLGTRQELGMTWVLPRRGTLMDARPWLNLHLYFSSGPDLLLRVRTLEIDCAVTSSALSDPKLESFQLHREDYAFVGASRLLARTPLARPVDAERHTLIDASPEMPLFRYWRDAPGGGDRLRFERCSWLGSIAAIRHQVIEGAGVAVLPQYFVRKELASGKLQRLFPRVKPVHDFFRLVFRSADPRRAIFESLANDLASFPLQ
jgi:DNA-binding transcriptional LysR family regulator